MARARLEDLGGLERRTEARALRSAGIRNLDDLRWAAYARVGRADLAAKSGLSEAQILVWIQRADLCRIAGVGPETAALLVDVGVQSVRELATKEASELAADCIRLIRDAPRGRRRHPSVGAVRGWISRAHSLPPGFEK